MRSLLTLPPDWVMQKIKTLRHPFLNKAEVGRRAGVGRGRVAFFARNPFMTSRRDYNKIAAVMKWPEWTDDE